MGIIIKDIEMLIYNNGIFRAEKNDVYIEKDIIAGIGERPEGFVEEEVIDGTNRMLIPGLINCHTHSYMATFRNSADDLAFNDWLFGNIEPREEKMTEKDAYWGACLAIMEMLKSGTTCFSDMQMHIHQTTQAVVDTGMRAVISRGLVGSGNNEAGQMRLTQAKEEMERWKDEERLTFLLGPHAPYTCDKEYLSIVAEEAKKLQVGIHIHLSESRFEIEQMQKNNGCTPIAYANDAGVFDVNTIAAHCVHVTDEDIAIMKDKNVSVATNPASNMKLGNGFAPVPKYLQAGVNVCLGTDGAASNNSLNLIHEMSLVTLIHKGVAEDAQTVSAQDALKMATVNGARALGLADKIGKIEVGMKADLAILRLDVPQMIPRNNLVAALSYSANGSEVETVLVDGKIVVKDGHMTTIDEEQVYYEAEKISERIGK